MTRRPRCKLTVRWSKREKALLYDWDPMICGGADGGILADYFERVESTFKRTLVAELKDRGYDITTLRFSVELPLPSERTPTLNKELAEWQAAQEPKS